MSTPSKGPYTVELNSGRHPSSGIRLEGPGMPEGNAEGFGFPAIHVSSKKLYALALAKCLSAAHAAGAERATQLEGERDALQREVEALRRELAPHDEQEQARREAEDGYNSAMETAGF